MRTERIGGLELLNQKEESKPIALTGTAFQPADRKTIGNGTFPNNQEQESQDHQGDRKELETGELLEQGWGHSRDNLRPICRPSYLSGVS